MISPAKKEIQRPGWTALPARFLGLWIIISGFESLGGSQTSSSSLAGEPSVYREESNTLLVFA